MAKEQKNQNLLIIAIVGIVAIVALIIFSKGGTGKAGEVSLESFKDRCEQAGGTYSSFTSSTGGLRECCERRSGEDGLLLDTCTEGGNIVIRNRIKVETT